MNENIVQRACYYAKKVGCFVVRHWIFSVAVFLACLPVYFWWLGDDFAKQIGYKGTDNFSSRLNLVRDVVILLGAAVALWLAFRRNRALDEQSKAATDNVVQARDRMENDQFIKAVELMAKDNNEGKPEIGARVGGIYILRDLALHKEKWEEFAPRIIRHLMAYIKANIQREHLAQEKNAENQEPVLGGNIGEDIKAAFIALEEILDECGEDLQEVGEISKDDLSFADQDFSYLRLDWGTIPHWGRYSWKRANLQGANCFRAKMSGADFTFANFEKANIAYTKMCGANLTDAKMKESECIGTDFRGAEMYSVKMAESICRHADFRGVRMLTAHLTSADFIDAKFDATDFRRAFTGVARFPLHEDLHGRIWHSNQKELKGVTPRLDEANWDDILSEFANDGFALSGLLYNFGDIANHRPAPIALGLRQAMLALCRENKLPRNFPSRAKNFLRELNPDGTGKGNQDN